VIVKDLLGGTAELVYHNASDRIVYDTRATEEIYRISFRVLALDNSLAGLLIRHRHVVIACNETSRVSYDMAIV
jgi:hypothetical protein